jgi:hypothetical protein
MKITAQKLLTVYSGVLTVAFSSVILLGARKPAPNASFDQITVHRINIVEPDGTTRMVLSDEAEFRGLITLARNIRAPTGLRQVCSSTMKKERKTVG